MNEAKKSVAFVFVIMFLSTLLFFFFQPYQFGSLIYQFNRGLHGVTTNVNNGENQ